MQLNIKLIFLLLSFMHLAINTDGQAHYQHIKDICYVNEDEKDAYRLDRCKLDIYYPTDIRNFATIVWFHGGGLISGNKKLCSEFKNQGFAVVDVNYRLSPKAKCPAYLEDAGEAVAWVFKHIEEYGGNVGQIYVGGHSAGAYLTSMITLDSSYISRHGVSADKIVKSYPVSGQTTTHYAIRAERNLPRENVVTDEFAPLNKARQGGAPIMLITGDRDLEMLARHVENKHLYIILKHFKHPVEFYELEGFNHGSVLSPACLLIRSDIKKIWKDS